MTFSIGRNQIHIGLWEAGGLIIAIAAAIWQLSSVVHGFEDKQKQIFTQNAEILTILKVHDKKDTIQDAKIDTLFAREKTDRDDIRSTRKTLNELAATVNKKRTISYFTEKRIKGHIEMDPVKKP